MSQCHLCRSYVTDSLEMILCHAFPKRGAALRLLRPQLIADVMADLTHYTHTFPVKYKKRLAKLEKVLADAGKEAAVDYLVQKEPRLAALLSASIELLWDAGVGTMTVLDHVLRNAFFDLFMTVAVVHGEHKRVALGGATAPRLLTDFLVDDEHFSGF